MKTNTLDMTRTVSSGLFLLLATFFLVKAVPTSWYTVEAVSTTASSIIPSLPKTTKCITKSIEDIRIGSRVLGKNPEIGEASTNFPEPDPRDSKLITLVMPRDGKNRLDVQLIRSRQWLEQVNARVGGTVYLELPEMSAVGIADVLSITSCPPIEKGHGNIVTGVFRHESARTVEVHISGVEPINCTAGHLFWSVDEEKFVPATELHQGESVLLHRGRISHVVDILQRHNIEPVYNIEVHNEHVYEVTSEGVLVHNTSAATGREFFMDAKDVFFTQDKISVSFQDKSHGTIHDLASGLSDNTIAASDLPAILIFRDSHTGKVYGIGNRRLWAAKEAGTKIKVQEVVDPGVIQRLMNKYFTTTNGGTSIIIQ